MVPIVEVVCVAYKRYGPLKVLIQSFLNQTRDNWTLRVYHDGYDPSIDKLVADFGRTSSRDITVHFSERRFNDYGHSLREMALRSITGDFVLLTNDDNYYVPRFIEYVTIAIMAINADVVLYDMIHSHDKPGGRDLSPYSFFQTSYRRGNIDIGSAVVRADLARRAGFRDKSHDGDATYFEDVARVAGEQLRIIKLPQVLFVHN